MTFGKFITCYASLAIVYLDAPFSKSIFILSNPSEILTLVAPRQGLIVGAPFLNTTGSSYF